MRHNHHRFQESRDGSPSPPRGYPLPPLRPHIERGTHEIVFDPAPMGEMAPRGYPEEEESGDYDRGWHDGWRGGQTWRRVLVLLAVSMIGLAVTLICLHR